MFEQERGAVVFFDEGEQAECTEEMHVFEAGEVGALCGCGETLLEAETLAEAQQSPLGVLMAAGLVSDICPN